MTSRSSFVFGSGAAILSASHIMTASAANLVPLRIAASPTDSTAQGFYAQDMGFFKNAGFDVQIDLVRNTSALVAGLVGGSLDIIAGSIVPVAQAHNSGIDIRVIGPGNIYAGPPTPAAIVTGMNSTIKTGGDSKSIKIVEVAFPEIPAALAAGRVEAGMLVEPFASSSLKKGEVRILGDAMAPIGPRFMLTGWFATAKWLAANRDSAHRYVNVMYQTAKWANGHHAESAGILSKYAKLPLEAVQGMARAYYGEVPLTAAVAQPVLDAASKYVGLQTTSAADLLWTG
jgi:NitT/TauT family transport system substrate-binding protein